MCWFESEAAAAINLHDSRFECELEEQQRGVLVHGGLTVDRQRDNEENQDAREQRESPASRETGRFPPLHGRLTVVASDEEGTNQKRF